MATIIFIAMQLLDYLTTILGITYFGKQEMNPLANAVGLPAICVIKFVYMIFVAIILQFRLERYTLFGIFQWTIAGLCVCLVLWNTAVLGGII